MKPDKEEMGYSILYPYRGTDVKFQAFTVRIEFRGVSA